MKEEIRKELKQFEKEYGITIIAARDTGSRAWNLHSEESDYDVSFIYIQPHHDYITPSGYTQNIDRETSTDYDIEYNSWNLDRFLGLLKGSNPAAIEFLQSSLTYYEPRPNYMEDLEEHAANNFKPLALMMHHHNLAKNQNERYIKNKKDHTVKRHLYAIRSMLYREYLKSEQELPSLDFEEFLKEEQEHFGSWRNYTRDIKSMVSKKKNGAGDKTVKTRKIAKKINTTLKEELSDEQKQRYAQQNIDREFLNQRTEEFIKDLNKEEPLWNRLTTSISKALTTN